MASWDQEAVVALENPCITQIIPKKKKSTIFSIIWLPAGTHIRVQIKKFLIQMKGGLIS